MSISTTFVSSYPIKWRHVFPSGKLVEHSLLPEVITENLLESPNRKPQKHRRTLKSAEICALGWEDLAPRNGNSPNLINRCNINRYSILIVLFPVGMNRMMCVCVCVKSSRSPVIYLKTRIYNLKHVSKRGLEYVMCFPCKHWVLGSDSLVCHPGLGSTVETADSWGSMTNQPSQINGFQVQWGTLS